MRSALAFLTPVGRARTPDPGTLAWFPVVGAVIGAVLGVLWWGMGHVWPVGVDAALVVAADLGLTGMLHMDGLLDSADGLFLHGGPERRLAVMRRSDVGAFGAAVGGSVLLLRWVTLVAIVPSPVLLGSIWAVSRGAMAVAAGCVPYAREEGLASAFVGGPEARRPAVVAGLLGGGIGLAGLLWWQPIGGAATLLAEAAAASGVVAFGWKRVGGFTGDLLGAAAVVAETIALLVAAARW